MIQFNKETKDLLIEAVIPITCALSVFIWLLTLAPSQKEIKEAQDVYVTKPLIIGE